MKPVDVFEWTYTPAHFLEHELSLSGEGYTLDIANGKARAEVDSAFFDANPGIREYLHETISSRLLAAQLHSHGHYDLSKSGRIRTDENGKRVHFLEAEAGIFITTSSNVDFRIIDANGRVKVDTRQERLDRIAILAIQIDRHRADETLARMLRSYHAAVKDPADEFVHLYEIADALKIRFNRKLHRLRDAIGFEDLDLVEQLYNARHIRQSRHRGLHLGEHRDATKEELGEARTLARTMIEKYATYLDRQTQNTEPNTHDR